MGRKKSESIVKLPCKDNQHKERAKTSTYGSLTEDVSKLSNMCISTIKDVKSIMKNSPIKWTPQPKKTKRNRSHESYSRASCQENSRIQTDCSVLTADVTVPAHVCSVIERLARIGVTVDECYKTLNVAGPSKDSNINHSASELSQVTTITAGHLREPSSVCMAVQNTCEDDEELTPFSLLNFQEDAKVDSDDDGLARIWQDMAFCRQCIEGQDETEDPEPDPTVQGCDHRFYLKNDMGLVCEVCGLVGQDIETIFQISWGNVHKKKHRKHLVSKDEFDEHSLKDLIDKEIERNNKQNQKTIAVHSQFKGLMHLHQLDGFHFLEKNIVGDEPGGCILAHAPGTGKTFLVIAFLRSFLEAYPDERVLIMAPKGMLLPWVKEFKKWNAEDIPLLNLYDNSSSGKTLGESSDWGESFDINASNSLRIWQCQKVKEWQSTRSILFVSYHHFSSLVKYKTGNPVCMELKKLLLEVPGILILDEGHITRNSDTQILKGLMHVHTKRRILLSGTLFQNNFEELFTLFKLVRPDFLRSNASCAQILLDSLLDHKGKESHGHAKNIDSKSGCKRHNAESLEQKMFVECLGEKIQFGSIHEQNQTINLLKELTDPFVHWYRGQVLDNLPGLNDYTIFLSLTKAQEKAFVSLQKQAPNKMEREIKSALICVHPSLLKLKVDCTQQSQEKDESLSAAGHGVELSLMNDEDPNLGVKTKFVLDMVLLCHHLNEKVLVFSQYLQPLSLLEKIMINYLHWAENRQLWRLEGNTPAEAREKIIDSFNMDPESRVLFASIKACGEGVSLIGASRIVFLDLTWNPAVTQQAISRAFRIGQSKRVYAYRLVGAGTLDEEIHRSASKKEWIAKVVSHASNETNFDLYSKEVDPQQEDLIFESPELKRLVKKCYKNS